MTKPIDMQILVKNVDPVAKYNKFKEQILNGQQMNAQMMLQKENLKNRETIVKSKETEKNYIEKNPEKKNKHENLNLKNKKGELEEEEIKKAKEPDKGNWLDIEV